jgi:DNA-binding response OmpR family regulator
VSKILIIDDDPAMRGLLRLRLEPLYEVIDTGKPEDALALALQVKPDCILLDLMMPKFSGFEVCQTLASLSHTQNIPILIVSGEAASRYQAFCQGMGAAGYFEKPINFDELKTRIAEVLSTKLREHRAEARVRLRVTLKLKGTDSDGAAFEEVTSSENVSANGFQCIGTAKLKEGLIVSVSTLGDGEMYAEKARVVWVESYGERWCLAGFQFLAKPQRWVLQ